MKRRELEAEVARLQEEADRGRVPARVWEFLRDAGIATLTLGMYAVLGVTVLAGALAGALYGWMVLDAALGILT